eukprot:CAMPEP_0118662304 /NCGR_PEP_ID=MMETSP0785-20121206/16757_1 /TAXON_ID=91992 /ORGANISM="Bolidomonas pacifica, Strain CCMP 1866" /LENGTH=165 /DNA_ID=CAMNT_0006555833 /DNA_START=116 /DNA_END=610 /DNA_ORIENTATION=-
MADGDDEKGDSSPVKEMTSMENFFMYLMLISQAGQWAGLAFTLASTDASVVYPLAISGWFFAIWAVWNRLTTIPAERAYYTFPLHTIPLFLHGSNPKVATGLSIFFCLLQWLNYAAPYFLYINKYSAAVLAGKRKKTLLWGKIIKVNMASALLFWALGLVLAAYE